MTSTNRPAWVRALLDKGLSPTEFRVWSYLSWRQGENSHAWPSQRRIAADLGLTVQAIRNITRRLHRKGWLTATRPNGFGRGHAIAYRTTYPHEKVNDGLPIRGDKRSTAVEVLEGEKVNGGMLKRSTAVYPNTNKGTLPKEYVWSEAMRLATLLRDLILQRQPKNKARHVNMEKWADPMRLLMTRNERTPAEIEKALRYAMADTTPRGLCDFCWANVIESPAGLRRNFDTIERQMNSNRKSKHGRDKTRDFTRQRSSVGSAVEM